MSGFNRLASIMRKDKEFKNRKMIINNFLNRNGIPELTVQQFGILCVVLSPYELCVLAAKAGLE